MMNEIALASAIGAGVFGATFALSLYLGGDGDGSAFVEAPQRPLILSSRSANEGAPAYDHFCSHCHGSEGQGGDRGPPLVHPLYDIGGRTDLMYFTAIRRGAAEKHWEFGPMPPVRNITPRQASAVVGFIAELQAFNAR